MTTRVSNMTGEQMAVVPCMPIISACRSRIIGCACGWVLDHPVIDLTAPPCGGAADRGIPVIEIGRAGSGIRVPASVDSDDLWAHHAASRMAR